MIFAIAALDQDRGIATDDGIPWKLPSDQAYFRDKTAGASIVMGYRMYQELKEPLPDRRNIVMIRPGTSLRPGFEGVEDVDGLIRLYKDSPETLWIVGGASVYEMLLPYTQKLYLTRIQAGFACTKIFPAFEDRFELLRQSGAQQENGLKFCYEIWGSQPVLKQNQV